ncbi:MAG TPA: DUF6067 family protein [Planctomycetota bacterium]|nr:DUF6067 family protein [Planctomycetota bacterium]
MRSVLSLAILGLTLGAAMAAAAGESPVPAPAPAGGAAGVSILGENSPLRGYLVFRTPEIVTAAGELKVPLEPEGKDPKPLRQYHSPPPPADWTSLEFDDLAWDFQRAPVELARGSSSGGSHAGRYTGTTNSLICLRAGFRVDDPAAVRDLKLSVEYVGGLAVYLNGREIARAHLPAGELKADTPAEKYPDDLHVEPDGSYLQDPRKNQAGFDRRYRKLADVAVPAAALRKGVNVLALEVHRAPINEAVVGAKRVNLGGGMNVIPGLWAYSALKSVSLSSASEQGIAAGTGRPKGVQVWNVGPYDTIDAFRFAEARDLRPVVIHAARNSVFSGRLAVSSDADIRGLKVTVGELKASAGAGAIPASAVSVRIAEAPEPGKSWTEPHRFDVLAEAIPAVIPVAKVKPGRGMSATLPAGAVAPLWITVRVPRDAAPGSYEGTVTVSADGLAPVKAPLVVKVSGWTLPDPVSFRVRHLAYYSTDSEARHYGVPLWSDKHFALMEKLLKLMAEVNAREIPATLAINFHSDNKGDVSNEESLVRWIKQSDGSYKYDFTLYDRFMELAAKTVGKPCPLRVACWGEPRKDQGQLKMPGWPAYVSVLDPATGKLDKLAMPVPGTEESVAFWKPVLDEVRKKAEARGWWDVTAIGHNSYCYPPLPETVSMAKKIWPDGVWSYIAHNGTLGGSFGGVEKDARMPVKYSVSVWNEGRLSSRGARDLIKPRPGVWCATQRNRHNNSSPATVIRNLAEEAVSRGMDGCGDFGINLYPIPKESGRGYYSLGNGRGTGGPNCSQRSLLAPGPDGAVATERFEWFREGTELSEAILFLESALAEGKAGGDLAGRSNRLLDERSAAFIDFWYSRAGSLFGDGQAHLQRWSPPGLARMDAELLALCGEVANTTGGK